MTTIVNAILLRGLPFDQPDSIVSLITQDARGRSLGVSRLDFFDWRDQAHSFSGLTMFQQQPMSVSDEGRPAEQRFGAYTTSNMLSLVGERPFIGRDFLPADDQPGAGPVAIIGNGVWTTRYGLIRQSSDAPTASMAAEGSSRRVWMFGWWALQDSNL